VALLKWYIAMGVQLVWFVVPLNVHKVGNPMNKVQIYFIYADNCKDCEKAKKNIEIAIQESNIECEVKMFNSENRVAVNIAITNEISEIPACVVGNGVAVFQGTNFNKEDIISALKKVAL